MEERTYYYAIVPNKEQNLGRQIAAFRTLSVHGREIITDDEKSSGDTDRAGYQALKNSILKRGDTLVIKSLDRLSQNRAAVPGELRFFREKGVRLKVMDLPSTMTDFPEDQAWAYELVYDLLIEVYGTIAEQEREAVRNKRTESITAAGETGRKRGRPPLTYPANWNSVYTSWKAGEITAKTAMAQTGTKRTSFYKLVGMTENR